MREKPQDELEAYYILIRYEDELGFPVIWDIVVEAFRKYKEQLGKGVHK